MSIRTTHRIWQFSSLAGTELLVLLALGHYANDEGALALPSMEVFAARVRLSVPAAKDMLLRLERKGELRQASHGVYEIVCVVEDLKSSAALAAREARS